MQCHDSEFGQSARKGCNRYSGNTEQNKNREIDLPVAVTMTPQQPSIAKQFQKHLKSGLAEFEMMLLLFNQQTSK